MYAPSCASAEELEGEEGIGEAAVGASLRFREGCVLLGGGISPDWWCGKGRGAGRRDGPAELEVYRASLMEGGGWMCVEVAMDIAIACSCELVSGYKHGRGSNLSE